MAPPLLSRAMLGLVLTAGGARGAYQAGVLKRIAEVPAFREGPSPFRIVAGASAGAINGSMVAARSGTFHESTRLLARLWSELSVEQVIRVDPLALGASAVGLLRDLFLGGVLGTTVTHGFFDTSPLQALVARHLPGAGVAEAIRRGHLYALAISAASYHSGRSFTFVQGRKGHPLWKKSRRVAMAVEIRPEHVCASAAIPLVFQPVRVGCGGAGDLWFGDGGLRLVTPCSPAIRLGATHLFAVGIRSQRAADALDREELGHAEAEGLPGTPLEAPPVAQICGVFMNAIFLDHLDSDLDHLRRMNALVRAYGADRPAVRDDTPEHEPMRVIEPCVVSPSEDLALVAQRFAHRMPRLLRYVLDGLGTPDAQSADLMSYLLFDASYTRALLDVGYRDADARIDEIAAFLDGARERHEPAIRVVG